MRVLEKLAARYEDLVEMGAAPAPNYEAAYLAFCLVLTRVGRVSGVDDLRVARRGAWVPRKIIAPRPPMRTRGVASGAFWDKSSYVLGQWTLGSPDATGHLKSNDRVAREYEAFRDRHADLLADSDDEGLLALQNFLRCWTPDQFPDLPHCEAMRGENICFRLESDSVFLHDRSAAHRALARDDQETSLPVRCSISGDWGPLARLHPVIKGLGDGPSAGGRLVSFNAAAGESYGKIKGENAQVAVGTAFAYGSALNVLLGHGGAGGVAAASGRRVRLGSDDVVLWGPSGTGLDIAIALLTGADPRRALDATPLLTGHAGETPLEILALNAATGRPSVRYLISCRLDELIARFQNLWGSMASRQAGDHPCPSLAAMIEGLDDGNGFRAAPAQLAGEVARNVLTGRGVPRAILPVLLMRVRSERTLGAARAGLFRAILTPEWEPFRGAAHTVEQDSHAPAATRAQLLGALCATFDQAPDHSARQPEAVSLDAVLAAGRPREMLSRLRHRFEIQAAGLARRGFRNRALRLGAQVDLLSRQLAGLEGAPGHLTPREHAMFYLAYRTQIQDLGEAVGPEGRHRGGG